MDLSLFFFSRDIKVEYAGILRFSSDKIRVSQWRQIFREDTTSLLKVSVAIPFLRPIYFPSTDQSHLRFARSIVESVIVRRAFLEFNIEETIDSRNDRAISCEILWWFTVGEEKLIRDFNDASRLPKLKHDSRLP